MRAASLILGFLLPTLGGCSGELALPAQETLLTFNGATLADAESSTEIDVFWGALNEPMPLRYAIFVAKRPAGHDFANPFLVAPPDSSTWRLANLAPNTTYYIVVRVQDAAGNRDNNEVEVSASTEGSTPTGGGGGGVDFATQVLPIFLKNCVRCHGGFDGVN